MPFQPIPRLLFATPLLASIAARWAADHERSILRHGAPLTDSGFALAKAVGVAHPERVRVLIVSEIPQGGGRLLAPIARRLGISADGVAGMALGYGIYLHRDYADPHVLAHELRHMAQYEEAGSIRAFMARYVAECLTQGYANAASEADAREWALKAIRGFR